MDKSAISASSAFNVEQKMQELKKKKDNYLSNQGRQIDTKLPSKGVNDKFDNNQNFTVNTMKSGSPTPIVVDSTSEQLKYQIKDAKNYSHYPSFRDKIPSMNDRNDEMIVLEQQAVMSSLMKTSDQEREMDYD